jgi:hypothetical protein
MLDEYTNGRAVELLIFCLFIHACTLYPGGRQLPLERVFTKQSFIVAVALFRSLSFSFYGLDPLTCSSSELILELRMFHLFGGTP